MKSKYSPLDVLSEVNLLDYNILHVCEQLTLLSGAVPPSTQGAARVQVDGGRCQGGQGPNTMQREASVLPERLLARQHSTSESN